MNIQFVRLEEDVCERLNIQALEQQRTVSGLVNEIVREHLSRKNEAAGGAGTN
jgi:hypothetical protein